MSTITTQTEIRKQQGIMMTPFQIFCYQNREKTSQMNPTLKGTTITSILAKVWRSMDASQKQYFEDMSKSLRNPDTLIQPNVTQITPVQYKPEPVIQVTNLAIPKLVILSKRQFGRNAAEASQKAILQ